MGGWQQRTDSTGMMVLAQSRCLSSRYLRDTAALRAAVRLAVA
eukprot:COSAG06_NODE_55681_length_288_cov_1.084656_1_plen_42_part_01